MKRNSILFSVTFLLLAGCGGTMSTYQKVTVPYRYLPLKPGISMIPYFIEPEPYTKENASLVQAIHFSSTYGSGESSAEDLPLASSADEAKLRVKLHIGELQIISTEASPQAMVVEGKAVRKYRYLYYLPVTAEFISTEKGLLRKQEYNNLMQHITQALTEDEFIQSKITEEKAIKKAYFEYVKEKLIDDFTKLFYVRNLSYDATVGSSGIQKRMNDGNKFSIHAMELIKSGQHQIALPDLQQAIAQYESLINDQSLRKNGQPVVTVREKAIAYYNCAHAYMWLKEYDKAQEMISQALQLCQEYDSDSLNSDINSDRFMFPRLQEEIQFRYESMQAAK